MVSRRESGFQRVYDVTERVVPAAHLNGRPSDAERRRQFTSGALRALGVTTSRWVADYFRDWARPYSTPKASALGLAELVEDGQAIPVEVEGIAEPAWLDAALLPRLEDLRAGRGKPTLTTFLSPFDNLIWHRGRMQDLWDFSLPDRGLHAGAEAGLRLLHHADPAPRRAHRPPRSLPRPQESHPHRCARSSWSRISVRREALATRLPARSGTSPASSAPTKCCSSATTPSHSRPMLADALARGSIRTSDALDQR